MKWIKINDDGTSDVSPGNLDDVLVYDSHSKEVIACYLWRTDDTAYYDSNGVNWSWIPHSKDDRKHFKPTHWMKWPDPPEVE